MKSFSITGVPLPLSTARRFTSLLKTLARPVMENFPAAPPNATPQCSSSSNASASASNYPHAEPPTTATRLAPVNFKDCPQRLSRVMQMNHRGTMDRGKSRTGNDPQLVRLTAGWILCVHRVFVVFECIVTA